MPASSGVVRQEWQHLFIERIPLSAPSLPKEGRHELPVPLSGALMVKFFSKKVVEGNNTSYHSSSLYFPKEIALFDANMHPDLRPDSGKAWIRWEPLKERRKKKSNFSHTVWIICMKSQFFEQQKKLLEYLNAHLFLGNKMFSSSGCHSNCLG